MIESGYFFNPIIRNISMIQGDTCAFGFQLQGLEGEEPESVILTCRETIEANDSLFEISTEDTIDKRSYDSETDTFTYTVRIPPHLTQNLPLGRYFYDLQITSNTDVITLMTGRLELEHQVTRVTVPSPIIETGDNIKYPNEDIIIGKVRAYTESYINEIGNKINEVLSAEGQYTTAEMSEALSEVKTDLGLINDAINYVLDNGAVIYTIQEMPSAVRSFNNKYNALIDNSIVNLKSDVTKVASYKFYMALDLETVELSDCNEIESNAFYFASGDPALRMVKLDCRGLEGDFAIGSSAFANVGITSQLKDFIVDGVRYIGMVTGSLESESNPTVEVFDPLYYGDDNIHTVTAEVDDIAVNSETGETYIYSGSYWRIYMPAYSATLGDNAFYNTPVRNLGFKLKGSAANSCLTGSSILFAILDKNFGTIVNKSFYQAAELRGVFQEVGSGELSYNLLLEEIGVSSVSGSFAGTTNLKYISLPYCKTVKSYGFMNSGLKTINLPAIETVGHTSRGAFEGCVNLETVTLGNGSKAVSFGGSTSTKHFYGCSNLWSLTLNSTSFINLTGSSQTMANILGGTPIINYLGTTETAISEGSTVTSLTINGSTVNASNDNIVSYGGKDWILVSGAWTEWGTNQNKTPRIKVPSDQISSYTSNSKWNVLNSSVWQSI